jgi:hypothetical protein
MSPLPQANRIHTADVTNLATNPKNVREAPRSGTQVAIPAMAIIRTGFRPILSDRRFQCKHVMADEMLYNDPWMSSWRMSSVIESIEAYHESDVKSNFALVSADNLHLTNELITGFKYGKNRGTWGIFTWLMNGRMDSCANEPQM